MQDGPIAYRYRDTAIRTANPVQLIVILYDGAIQALREAQDCLKKKDIAGRGSRINRALAIISHLQASLDFNQGGEIAASLDRLYSYMRQKIFNASVEQRVAPIAEVTGLLESLRSAWCDISSQLTKAEFPSLPPMTEHILKTTAAVSSTHGSLNISG